MHYPNVGGLGRAGQVEVKATEAYVSGSYPAFSNFHITNLAIRAILGTTPVPLAVMTATARFKTLERTIHRMTLAPAMMERLCSAIATRAHGRRISETSWQWETGLRQGVACTRTVAGLGHLRAVSTASLETLLGLTLTMRIRLSTGTSPARSE